MDACDQEDMYARELSRLRSYIQSRHSLGQVKHIGMLECISAAIELLEMQRPMRWQPYPKDEGNHYVEGFGDHVCKLRSTGGMWKFFHPFARAWTYLNALKVCPVSLPPKSEADSDAGKATDDSDTAICGSWLLSVGFYHEGDYGGERGYYHRQLGDGVDAMMLVCPEKQTAAICRGTASAVGRSCSTRRELRRMWYGWTGQNLEN